MSTIKSVWY